MLLDQFAPRPHFRERHGIDVGVLADEAYRAIWATDFGTSPLIRGLLLLRTVPSLLIHGRAQLEVGRTLTLQTLLDSGFGLLAETPGREVVLGVVGRFWRPDSGLRPFRPEDFTGELPPGFAKAVWNFAVEDRSAPGQPVRVVTETRVVCADRTSALQFGLYWALIRPFSGLIRIIMLRAIRRTCATAGVVGPGCRGVAIRKRLISRSSVTTGMGGGATGGPPEEG